MRDFWRLITGERRVRHDPAALARGDPWVRLSLVPPLRAYGPGARLEFTEYLAGTSRVPCRTPEDIARWLLTCRYADDRTLLDEPDEWLHPSTFEVVRCGDCEDFSLWAWRKMIEASIEAEFVVGVRHRPDGKEGRHAWAVFRRGGEDWVLDGVERSLAHMIRPVSEARAEYEPQVGVCSRAGRFVYAGFYRSDWGRAMVDALEDRVDLT